ncbi:MAG: metallophosphoesterase [Nitrospirota bacterium]|nr:metallophosphoesterase [Nitrospirota bacterium]
MNLFLITVFLLYSALHLYAFLKAKAAFHFSNKMGTCLLLLMVIMAFAPVLIRLSEKHGLEFIARIMSYIGYTWMGVLFLFFFSSLVIDLYHLLVYLSSLFVKRDLIAFAPSAKFSFFMPLLLSITLGIYGYYEAINIRTEKFIIKTSKISQEVGRLKIVQISDVHLGLIIREKRLERILKEVKRENPDIFISTGDLVDGQINNISELTEPLKKINPRFGKFAITGNHEFIAGLDQALDFTEKAGFSILRGEGVNISDMITIVGVDDPAGKRYGLFKDVPEKELLSGFPKERFLLLLKHRPDVDKDALGLFDLQLSGHVHKGQIFPFSLITRLYYRHTADAGHLKLVDNSYLYVSRGAGTWGPPIRFLTPPEVTVIELVHEDLDNEVID